VREEGGPLGVGKGRSQIKRILGCGRNKKKCRSAGDEKSNSLEDAQNIHGVGDC